MYFLIIAQDKPGMLDKRLETRPAHKAYVARTDLPARPMIGAPLAGDDGETMTGTFLIVEAPDREAAEAYADGDPYVAAGIFESREIIPLHEAFEAERILPRERQ